MLDTMRASEGCAPNKTFRSSDPSTGTLQSNPSMLIFYFNWFFAAVFVYFNRLKNIYWTMVSKIFIS